MRTGFLLMWLFMAAWIVAIGLGIWLEHTRAAQQRRAEEHKARAEAAMRRMWDDFWASVVRDNYTVAELNRLYAITKASQ